MASPKALLAGKDPGIRRDGMSQVTGPSPAGMAPASKQPAELVEDEPAEGDSTGTPVLTTDVSQAALGAVLGPQRLVPALRIHQRVH